MNNDILYDATKGFTGDLASELIDSGVMDDLLPPQKAYQKKYRDTVRQVLYNLVRARGRTNATESLVRVAVPLTKIKKGDGHWGQGFLSYHRIRSVLNVFAEEDLIALDKGVPANQCPAEWLHDNGFTGKVTRFHATGDLRQAIQDLLEERTDLVADVEIVVEESGVWMKDDCAVSWVEDKPGLRERVETVNDAMPMRGALALPKQQQRSEAAGDRPSTITVRTCPPDAGGLPNSHEEAVRRCPALWSWEHRETDSHVIYQIPESAFTYRRKFCRGSFDCGGRYYADVQNIPSDWRRFMTLRGEAAVELDFDNLHFHMLYAERGLSFGGDAYDIGDTALRRNHIKLLANVLINARNHQQLYSWAYNCDALGAYTKAEIKGAVHGLKDRHSAIEDAFHSDAGIRLQNEDSVIAERVMTQTGAIGIHDGFMAPAVKERELRRAMKTAFATSYGGYEIPVSREHRTT